MSVQQWQAGKIQGQSQEGCPCYINGYKTINSEFQDTESYVKAFS